MKLFNLLAGAVALLIVPMAAQAQSTAEPAAAPSDQVGPAEPAADPGLAPTADTAAAAAPATTASADGVTKEGGKFTKDGRKATKVEVAEYKKAAKARHE